MKNTCAHADETDIKMIIDSKTISTSSTSNQALICNAAQIKTRKTQLFHAAVLMALSSLSMSFYQNNKHQLQTWIHQVGSSPKTRSPPNPPPFTPLPMN
jgi:hypothetical protein